MFPLCSPINNSTSLLVGGSLVLQHLAAGAAIAALAQQHNHHLRSLFFSTLLTGTGINTHVT